MTLIRLLLVGLLMTAACGDKPRVVQPPPSMPVDRPVEPSTRPSDQPVSAQPARHRPAPSRVRLLLHEGFDRLHLNGAQEGERLLVKAEDGRIQVFEREGTTLQLREEGSGFRFTPTGKGTIQVEGVGYRGLIDVFINPFGQPVAVNEIDLESYLWGVVPNELGPVAFPYLEALKAQAVAARTFAISGLGTFASRGFDLYSDSRSQVYTGVQDEHPLSNRAVRQTRGLVVQFQGKPISAFYSSTCGGRTEDYSRVFSGDPIPYLQGGIECTDQLSPYHSWSARISLKERAARLKERLAIECLTDMKLLHRSEAGRVEAIQFVGRNHQGTLRSNDFRVALGLRSNYILELDTQVDSRGCIQELNVRGKGWGHGVGLCQMGAVSMAQQGVDFAEILGHYYPGTQLSQLYASHP